jgi:ATP-dependent DNA helicase RecQ
MQQKILSVLREYWGHNAFRSLQEEIILSVLNGIDTLALLPTGGGKSICFQVPAMVKDGICIVVSPLIALMKDQVENLTSKGIKAAAIFSGMSRDEVDIALDNCIYGKIKFLYLSPERLLSELVQERISKMQVSLFAVDEAHCISQWGYDFRPPYLRIAEIRELHPHIPVLALTATATPEVRDDVMKQLNFSKPVFFQKSFERKNLCYLSYHLEDKQKKMVEIFSSIKGTGIVYVRNRKRTREYARILQENRISADYYHAGLTSQLRSQKQDDWKNNRTRIMVCTNAFGMGIDKPDVRSVIHMDLPDNLESYYQEAGRAGRDEKTSFAVVLYNKTDIADLITRQQNAFPPVSEIKKVYQAIANFLQVPVDAGMGVSYDFEISKFLSNYNFNPISTLNCLRVLETEGLIAITDSVFMPSRVHFKVNNINLYTFQVANPAYDQLIKTILRSAEGVFDDFARISEPEIATRMNISYEMVVSMLNYLQKHELLTYLPRKDSPQLIFTTPREDASFISIDEKKYLARKKRYKEKSEAVSAYVSSKHQCRSMMLLTYFGETALNRCGVCDYCRERNKVDLNEIEFENLKEKIFLHLDKTPLSIDSLISEAAIKDKKKVIEAIEWMVDREMLFYDKQGRITVVKVN